MRAQAASSHCSPAGKPRRTDEAAAAAKWSAHPAAQTCEVGAAAREVVSRNRPVLPPPVLALCAAQTQVLHSLGAAPGARPTGAALRLS